MPWSFREAGNLFASVQSTLWQICQFILRKQCFKLFSWPGTQGVNYACDAILRLGILKRGRFYQMNDGMTKEQVGKGVRAKQILSNGSLSEFVLNSDPLSSGQF